MISQKQFEEKFSRHIGRILSKIDIYNPEKDRIMFLDDIKEYTKGELWLLCNDLILMLGLKEGKENGLDKNTNR